MCFCVYILYSRYDLCLLLQILFVAALDIKTRDVLTFVEKTRCCHNIVKLHIFYKFLCRGPPTVRFVPVVPWAKAGPVYAFLYLIRKSLFARYDLGIWYILSGDSVYSLYMSHSCLTLSNTWVRLGKLPYDIDLSLLRYVLHWWHSEVGQY
jgi:hypothetical protein